MKTKKIIGKLEELIETAGVIFNAHGASEEGNYQTTYKEKNGKKKGYIFHKSDFVCRKDDWISWNVGTKMEYINHYPKGDVASFSLRMSMDASHLDPHKDSYKAKHEMKDYTTIEAWMYMRDNSMFYGKFEMKELPEVLDFKDDNYTCKKFIKLLRKELVGLYNADNDLFHRLYGK